MTDNSETVELLARALYSTKALRFEEWDELIELRRENYRHLARRLLADPDSGLVILRTDTVRTGWAAGDWQISEERGDESVRVYWETSNGGDEAAIIIAPDPKAAED